MMIIILFKNKGLISLKNIRNWFSNHVENLILFIILVIVTILYIFEIYGFFSFKLGYQAISILGTILQSLASIFAIVFSISLVAIQLCSENLSHRLIDLYVKNINFLVPAIINFTAIMSDFLIITNKKYICFANIGILLSIAAILSLISFFLFTIRFLRPVHVVGAILNGIKPINLLSENFTDRELYRKSLQPIEDIASNCIKNGDYATAQDIIELIRTKMHNVLDLVKERLMKESETRYVMTLINMSRPFSKLLEGIAVSSNKRDAIEITIYIIYTIGDFVEGFEEARFIPAFKIFENSIERIYSQASHRFSSGEYKIDFARLEVAIADARVSFSKFVM